LISRDFNFKNLRLFTGALVLSYKAISVSKCLVIDGTSFPEEGQLHASELLSDLVSVWKDLSRHEKLCFLEIFGPIGE